MYILGLIRIGGQLDESVPLPRALARGLAAQKHSGLPLAKAMKLCRILPWNVRDFESSAKMFVRAM